MAINTKQRQRCKPIAEINVVPYIDVMLVLLIIFMITAPLLTQGVQVNLPKAPANPIEVGEGEGVEPLVVSVDKQGLFYLTVGDKQDQPIDAQTLKVKVQAVLRRNQNVPIMVKGDSAVNYGQVMQAMVLVQQAGAPNIGLITKQPDK